MHRHNYAVSRIMMTYWTDFARTGDPKAAANLDGCASTESDEETLVFGNDGVSVERDFLKERLDLYQTTVWR